MPGLVHHLRPVSSTVDRSSEAFPKPLPLSHRLPPPPPPPPADETSTFLPFPSHACRAFSSSSVHVFPSAQIGKMQPAFPLRFGDHLRLEAHPPMLNYDSSGNHLDPSSVCLAAMVDEFMENEHFGSCKENSCVHRFFQADCKSNINDQDPAGNTSKPMEATDMRRILERFVRSSSDEAEATVLKDVQQIMGSLCAQEQKHSRDTNVGWKARVGAHGCAKRIVMSRLQNIGYNAAICKSRWDHSTGLSAGDYEYIDVLMVDDKWYKQPVRLIVDIDFPAQFEIARPTKDFSEIWQLLPQVFVGKPDRLQQIISVMSEATKKSLRAEGLHLPPWRKLDYMKAKWFSPHKRTTSNGSAHPCKEMDFSCNFSHRKQTGTTAVRRDGLYPDYTNELEMLFHDVNCMPNTNSVRTRSDQITVLASEWELPKLAQQLDPSSRKQAGAKVTGLVSLLLQGSSSGITAGAA